MNKNLHIAFDDKFIDYIIQIATDLQVSEDRFVIFGWSDTLKHVKSKNIEFYKHGQQDFWDNVGLEDEYSTVFVHYITGDSAKFVNLLPSTVRVVWCFWGGEFFNLEEYKYDFFEPLTLQYVSKNGNNPIVKKSFFYYLKHPYRSIVEKYQQLRTSKKRFNDEEIRAMKRVDYFAHFIEDDYKLIKKKLGLKAKFLPFHYASMEEMLKGSETNLDSTKTDILIGNSDTEANNHLDVLDVLSRSKIGNRKIICPLSYTKGAYAHDIAAHGTQLLPQNFVPILDFMPKDKYNELIGSVAIAVMYHKRSQAAGNVVVCMWYGVKVYMNPASTLYKFLKRNGLPVYSFKHDFDSANLESFEPLTEAQTENARVILLRIFGKNEQCLKIENLLTLSN